MFFFIKTVAVQQESAVSCTFPSHDMLFCKQNISHSSENKYTPEQTFHEEKKPFDDYASLLTLWQVIEPSPLLHTTFVNPA